MLASSNISQVGLYKSITLVGLMGCGKSAIGKKLSQVLNIPFYDMDHLIEEKEGQTISHIFTEKGEQYFRQLECDIAQSLFTKEIAVIATGGGAFIQEPIRQLIQKYTISVWLRAPLEVLLERVSRNNKRPLLANKHKADILKKLIKERYPIYEKADIIVDTTTGEHRLVVDTILSKINL